MLKLNNHSFFVIIQVKHKMDKELTQLKIWKRQMHVVLHVAWKDRFQKSIFINKVLKKKGRRFGGAYIHNCWRGEKPIPKRKEKGVPSILTRQIKHRKSWGHFLTVTPKMVYVTLKYFKKLQIIITGCYLQIIKTYMKIKGWNFKDW